MLLYFSSAYKNVLHTVFSVPYLALLVAETKKSTLENVAPSPSIMIKWDYVR